jgi:outer membrane protein TolC
MLGFQGSYSQSDHATGLQQKTNWSLGLNLSYTLIDSGRARAAMDEAASRRDSVRASLEETRSLVALQVERAYSSLTQALDRINVARATLDSASEAVRIAEIGYSEGVITYIDYQDADLGYRQAETMYLQAIYGYLIAESSLRAALGGAKTRAETDAACP